MSEDVKIEDASESPAPRRRGRQPKPVDVEPEHPAHAARLKEKSDRAIYLADKEIVSECYFLERNKLKKAKYDVAGSMKTEYVMDISKAKNKENFKMVAEILAKATGQPVGYLENRVLLEQDSIKKKYLLKPGEVKF